MPLYDILNEFQKGSSHMAAVVKSKKSMKPPSVDEERIMDGTITEVSSQSSSLHSKQDKLERVIIDIEKAAIPANSSSQIAVDSDISVTGNTNFAEDIEDGEVIGIITLEDVFEELLQVFFTVHILSTSSSSLLLKMPASHVNSYMIFLKFRRRL